MLILKGLKSSLHRLAFSPDGGSLAAGGAQGLVQLWDLSSGEVARKFATGWNNETVFFTPDGRGLFVLSANLLHELDLGLEYLGERPAGERLVTYAAAASPDRRQVCLYHPWKGNAIRQYRMPGFEPGWGAKILADASSGVTALAYSGDGRRLAVGRSSGPVAILDAATGAILGECGDGRPGLRAVALSPDGSSVAWCAASRLALWRVDPAEEVKHHTFGRTHFFAVAFHPSGEFFATANGDGKVDYWDAQTGEHRQAFDWGVGKLHDVIFDAAGDRAACCGKAGQIVVWDVDR